MTVSWRRSASAALEGSAGGARGAALRLVPHCAQNLAAGEVAVPHAGQQLM
jgi:hypothetical protein